MLDSLLAYLPQDRRTALVRDQSLPPRCSGAALFADISGFTPLTEAFTTTLGPRRGGAALLRQINLVYEVLLASVDAHAGSVIDFAGDAVTCWFDDHGTAGRGARAAVGAALAMQAAMAAFAAVPHPTGGTLALAVKIGIAAGPAYRFVVGDPQIQFLDALGGPPLDRMVAAEHLAQPGEILVDAATAHAAGERALEWRVDPAPGERFAVWPLDAPAPPLAEPPAAPPPAPSPLLTAEAVRPWLLPTVYERLTAGHGEFLTELRPAVACFVRFASLSYATDPAAPAKLDRYVRWAQRVVARTDGTLLQLTLGDKGSSLYAVWGAPVAHEDDAARAAQAALDLRRPPPDLDYIGAVQIGLTRGDLRTGACGSATRRTYAVMGDATNLAARLMQAAAAGQILASAPLRAATRDAFAWDPLPPLRVKGKRDPVAVAALLDAQPTLLGLHEPRYLRPLVGRDDELAQITSRLDGARRGAGQVIGVVGDAGVGKSRLLAAAVQVARAGGWQVYGGAAQALGTARPYLAWQPVWQAFAGLAPSAAPATDQAQVATLLTALVPEALARLPLLGPVLGVDLPDTALTARMDEKLRKESREALLVALLRARSARGPVLVVLEDCHWLDPLSHDLLEVVARAIYDQPVVLLLAYRPPDLARLQTPRVTTLPHFSAVALEALAPAEAAALLAARLAATRADVELPPALSARLIERAQGNPFYLEELLTYLLEQGIDLADPAASTEVELPASLHSLILSRVDQVSGGAQVTAKAASILGRLVPVPQLLGYAPMLGSTEQVLAALAELARAEIALLDRPEPELAYLFKHIMTYEAIYGSLTDEVRGRLHEQVAAWLEATASADLDLLAYHYGRSTNVAKRREYWRQAGDAAAAAYNNATAVEYYERLLAEGDPAERQAVLVALGDVLERTGAWDAAGVRYHEAHGLALAQGEHAGQIAAARGLGTIFRLQGAYAEAIRWAEAAHAAAVTAGDRRGVSQALTELGQIYEMQGEYTRAQAALSAGRAAAQAVGDTATEAYALQMLGVLGWRQGAVEAARAYLEASQALQQALGDKRGMATTLRVLGNVAYDQGAFAEAGALYHQALVLGRELGTRGGIATSLNNLGNVAYSQGALELAQTYLAEGLALRRELGDRAGVAQSLSNLGNVAREQGTWAAAQAYLEESLSVRRDLGDRAGVGHSLNNLGILAQLQGEWSAAQRLYSESLAVRRDLGDRPGIAYALTNLALVALEAGTAPDVRAYLAESLELCARLGGGGMTRRALLGVAVAHPAGLTTARLLGAVAGLLAAQGSVLEPLEQRLYDQATHRAQATLGAAGYTAAWTAGQALAWEAAVAEAQAALAMEATGE